MASALSVDARERAAFVHAQAGADEELRREVLSLLAAHEEAGEFLEASPMDSSSEPEPPEPSLAGVRVGAYELVREIGRGGMGTVYLAARADREFHQRVAVKLIRRGMENDFAVRRFRNERQILARLEHPNIARLLDGGTTTAGHPYFVMEYVEGEPLLAHCRARELGIRERVEIFRKACSAVDYAHRRMIVHRDLKPGNILVMPDGTPKLLDFGVAKILDPAADSRSEATQGGYRLITPAYASPEQVRGEAATVRSDIYTMGVVLWELLTGARAGFPGDPHAFDLPDSIADEGSWALLRSMHHVVLRAARPEPAERYESVAALDADLERALAGIEIPSGGPRAAELAPRGSIAILPFQFLGPEANQDSYLGLGITDALITRLSNVGRIAVRPTSVVMRFAGAGALEAGRGLNVQFVLEGLVQRVQGRVRVTVQLLEAGAPAPVWAAGFDAQLEDLLKVEDSISEQVAQALIPHLTGEEREYLAQSGTSSARAHEAYLRGRWYWARHTEDSLPQALVLFTEAIAEDPRYGRAYAGIADYHTSVGARAILPPAEAFAAAIESANTAIQLDPKLPEAHASLGFALWALDHDTEASSHHLQLAIALNPEYALAHDWVGLIQSARGRTEAALASIERARRLDPSSGIYAADLALCQYAAGRYDLAIACFEASSEPPSVINGAVLPLSLLAKGQADKAIETARGLAEATGRSTLVLGVLACVAAAAGDGKLARSLLDELTVKSRDYYVSGVALALASLACGRRQDALTHLERACRERDWWTLWLGRMPVWDALRGDPRFETLVAGQEQLGAPPSPPSKRRRMPLLLAAAALLAVILGLLALRFLR